MGAGKSYIARHLGAALQCDTADLDTLIETAAGQSIARIFEEQGEVYFRELEQKTLHQTLEIAPKVIALGGGTPVYHNNMDWIKEHGKSIFLDPPITVLLQRLEQERAQRPLLANLDANEFKASVINRLEQRRLFYEQADCHIRATNQESIVKACLDFLQA
jgi:shikimate kinase